jgi:hypothetical protein
MTMADLELINDVACRDETKDAVQAFWQKMKGDLMYSVYLEMKDY